MCNWGGHGVFSEGPLCCILLPADHPGPLPSSQKDELGNSAPGFGKAGSCSCELKIPAICRLHRRPHVLGPCKERARRCYFLIKSMTCSCSESVFRTECCILRRTDQGKRNPERGYQKGQCMFIHSG